MAFFVRRRTCCRLLSSVLKSHPFLSVLFILSARALCNGSPLCVILICIPRDLSLSTYSLQQYCTPRSKWCMSCESSTLYFLIDASIVDSPHRPDGILRITVADDREDTRSDDEKDEEEAYHKFLLQERKGTDGEARWVKKKVYRYGYKKHVLTNREGIIRQVITTPANRNDLKELIPLLREEDLPADTPVYADKGYATEENRAFLTLHHLRDCIMHKAYRNRPLSQAQHLFNRSISPIRSVIERTFGSIRRWFDGGRCRYRGLAKTHTQNILESIAFNLYRTPGLIISKCVK